MDIADRSSAATQRRVGASATEEGRPGEALRAARTDPADGPGEGGVGLSRHEIVASTVHYRTVGQHMGIKDIPETYEEFEACLDSYEEAHFGWDVGARRASDATLELMASWYPRPLAPLLRTSTLALLDEPLLRAFRYELPGAVTRALVRRAVRARPAGPPDATAPCPALRAAELGDQGLPGRLPRRRAGHLPGAGCAGLPRLIGRPRRVSRSWPAARPVRPGSWPARW